MIVEWASISIYFTYDSSVKLRKPGCDMWSQYQIICWTQESEFAP